MGRVVLPSELRRLLDIDVGSLVEMYVVDGTIRLKKYDPRCVFCGELMSARAFKDRCICARCREQMRKDFSKSE